MSAEVAYELGLIAGFFYGMAAAFFALTLFLLMTTLCMLIRR